MRVLIIILIVVLIIYLVLIFLKRMFQKRLYQFLEERDFNSFDKTVNSILIKWMFLPYNLEYLKLNRYLLEDDKEKVDSQFDVLLRTAKKSQKQDIFLKAFEYYSFERNKTKAKRYYNELKTINDGNLSKYVDLLYDVLVLNKTNHIEELEKDFDSLEVEQKQFYAQLLWKQYKSLKNLDKQHYYEKFLRDSTKS